MRWTFGRKIAAAFTVLVALTALVGLIATTILGEVVQAKDRVLQIVSEAKELQLSAERRVSCLRAYILTGNAEYVEQITAERATFDAAARHLDSLLVATDRLDTLRDVKSVSAELFRVVEQLMALQKTTDIPTLAARYTKEVQPKFERLRNLAIALAGEEAEATKATSELAGRAQAAILTLAGVVALLAAALGAYLARSLSQQVGSTVQHMRSSSTELQSAANQQASSSREQAAAIQEMTITMRELQATARQIGESSQHVAEVARDAEQATQNGAGTVGRGRASMATVKQQVDQVVQQMLALGQTSQRIGGILAIINELAEQTNILAVNATIEAAGAGEAGVRFGAVADEIRNLAGRMGGSTREIRDLVDEVRASVHSTVLTTESGSKAVDACSRQFDDVTASFERIAELVGNTAEASREIELSTRQQQGAVEQVTTGMTQVSQAAQEADVSARQTLATATQLSSVSAELLRVVQTEDAPV